MEVEAEVAVTESQMSDNCSNVDAFFVSLLDGKNASVTHQYQCHDVQRYVQRVPPMGVLNNWTLLEVLATFLSCSCPCLCLF